jgi:hypothetical protein
LGEIGYKISAILRFFCDFFVARKGVQNKNRRFISRGLIARVFVFSSAVFISLTTTIASFFITASSAADNYPDDTVTITASEESPPHAIFIYLRFPSLKPELN